MPHGQRVEEQQLGIPQGQGTCGRGFIERCSVSTAYHVQVVMICLACLQVNKDEPEAECAAREARLHPEHVGSRCSPSLRKTQHTGFRGAWVRHFAIFGGRRLCGGTNRQAVYPALHNSRHQ